ncbi:hypothetical protein [Butyrivibrio sp. NC3005]|uniref:hypothetical protein n=1 Tax=Butyrivibrio sp. NC3005 TaxID=1280685 RepID=UPI00041ADEBF|nr:hypothetical protein [Butyrivibrio sp. NC3005]
MKRYKDKGLLIYSLSIMIVAVLEFVVPYRPGALSILSYGLMLVKIPLVYLAIMNIQAIDSESLLKKSVLTFNVLLGIFIIDFIANIFCTFNFYSADIALMAFDFRLFFILFMLEILTESIAVFGLLKNASVRNTKISWAVTNAILLVALFCHMEQYFISWELPRIIDILIVVSTIIRVFLLVNISRNVEEYI